MPKTFIIRPFGVKEGVDFDAVEAQLIQPALTEAGLQGETTMEIFEAGNIREDMFRSLVTADLVVADLSIHNANVFYELGIRHGLRSRATFMLRASIHQFPFDLQTDRYLAYDVSNPAAAVAALARGLRATVDSQRTDSPVYKLLPDLKAPGSAALRVAPSDFREEVERARAQRHLGDLRLLAYEIRELDWESEGLHVVGRAQFNIKAWRGARETFERLRQIDRGDVEVNQRLATVYQRLNDLVLSDQAIARVIQSPLADRRARAEAFALRARNTKAIWRKRFSTLTSDAMRAAALSAPELAQAIENYAAAFEQDLNHFYPGLNALALLSIRIELAKALPREWNNSFDSDEEAHRKLEEAEKEFVELAGAVRRSLQAARDELKRSQTPDEDELLWTSVSEADFAFLTGPRPTAAAQRYRKVLTAAPEFAVSSVRDQLEIFRLLQVRTEFALEALCALPQPPADRPTGKAPRALLFTGHMVDAPNRKLPRFPNTTQATAAARALIANAVRNELALAPEGTIGIAGGACGSDILFHEVCAELGVETKLFLTLPKTQFCNESVAHGGADWVERFNRLCDHVPPRVLSESEQLPRWLSAKRNYTIWQRNNLWLLFNALAFNPDNITLIALWDGGKSDGPGGTEDLVDEVRGRGQKNVILPATGLKEYAAG